MVILCEVPFDQSPYLNLFEQLHPAHTFRPSSKELTKSSQNFPFASNSSCRGRWVLASQADPAERLGSKGQALEVKDRRSASFLLSRVPLGSRAKKMPAAGGGEGFLWSRKKMRTKIRGPLTTPKKGEFVYVSCCVCVCVLKSRWFLKF